MTPGRHLILDTGTTHSLAIAIRQIVTDRPSTRRELVRRLLFARDYIRSQLDGR